MSSSVARTLLLVSVIVSTAARADVGLVPTVVADLDEGAVRRSVEGTARLVVKEGLRPLGPDDLVAEGPGCLEAAPCRARAIARLGLAELARVDVTGTGLPTPFARARLTVWDRDGAVAFVDEQPLSTDRDLRGLLTRAFDPARATARLDVIGLQAGDALLIDGLPSLPEALLAPGTHTIVVVHADGSRTTEALTLAFEERRSFALPRRAAPGGAVWPSGLVPGVVSASVGVAGLAAAGALGLVALSGEPAQRDVAVVGAVVAAGVGILGAASAIVALWPASKEPALPSG